jgi:AhpD family alkylhydroperoxidase
VVRKSQWAITIKQEIYMTHAARLPYFTLAPEPFQHLYALSGAVKQGSLDVRLVDLVFLRVSQINGCAYCMDMHWRDLIQHGVDPRHLNAVAGWREASFFSEREAAALRWAEIVTATPHSDASDEEFARLKNNFTDVEIAELGFAIAVINTWNLLNVSFRSPIPEQV